MDYSEQISAALEMLDLFASVGAEAFDLTFKKQDETAKANYRKAQSVGSFRNSIPHLVPSSYENKFSLIARPRSRKVALIQLDDLTAEKAATVKDFAFLFLETSPKNYQAWVAVEGLADNEVEDFARRLKQGVGADVNASGATRWAGTMNFKAKYAPSFPIVRVARAYYGKKSQKTALEAFGLLSAPLPPAVVPKRTTAHRTGGKWPSYSRCLKNAPEAYESGKPTGKPDVSRADFTFSIIAADWGHSVDEIAARLQEESSKAQEPQHGEDYAALTARRAVDRIAARGRGIAP